MQRLRAGSIGIVILSVLTAVGARAQDEPPPQTQTFAIEEIDSLVAPVALYPDSLLAQVLMASTYPLEVVEASRFARANPDLADDALDEALKDKTWDASVKSLVSFPQVLTMMDEKLDWTQKLGDAFLAQQTDVMDAVQRLRAKAKAEGNLESNEQQKVIVEQAPAPPPEVIVQQAPPSQTVIVIEPADPQVVYVPTYNPTVVYGAWAYPAYPPYYYYPPGYVMGASMISFGAGMAVGAALWGDCDWGYGHGDVDVDIDNYQNFNSNVERNYNREDVKNKFKDGNWQHDPSHRKGAEYRDKATQQRFDRGTNRAGVDSREAFRGRAEQGRDQMSREGKAGIDRDVARAESGRQRDSAREPSRTASAGDRSRESGQTANRGDSRQQPSGATRDSPSGTRDRTGATPRSDTRSPGSSDRGRGSETFRGVGHGSEVRGDSRRGQSSRASASRSRGSTSRGSMPRGGGGGRRR